MSPRRNPHSKGIINPTFRRIVLGEMDGRITPRVQRTVAALQRMGITVEPTDNIRKVIWTKFVFIAGFSGVGALTRLEAGDYRAVPETRELMTRLMREVEALARAAGVGLDRQRWRCLRCQVRRQDQGPRQGESRGETGAGHSLGPMRTKKLNPCPRPDRGLAQ